MRRSHGKPRKQVNSVPEKSARGAWTGRFRLVTIGVGIAVLLLGGAWIVRTPAATQMETSTAAGQTAPAKPDAPGTIDGAKNPELIPDEVALRMLVLSVAEPPNATEVQITRARAKLAPLGLSEEDTLAVLSLLTDFRTQADDINKQAEEVYVRAPFPHPDSTDYERLVDLGTQQMQLGNNVVAALPARMSKEGFIKLLLYLPEAKKAMKMTNERLMSK